MGLRFAQVVVRAVVPVAAFVVCTLQAAGATQEAEPAVRLEFSALSLGEYLPNVCYVSEAQVRRMAVNNGSRSARQVYAGPGVVTFFREKPAEGGTVLREQIGSVDLTGREGPLLLLFDAAAPVGDSAASRAPGEQQAMRIFALDDGVASFPDGAYRLFNMTADPLAASLAGDVVTVKPYSMQTAVVPAPMQSGRSGSGSFDVVIGRFDAERSQWVRVYGAKWPRAAARRTLVLIYPDAAKPEGLGVRRVVQMLGLPPELTLEAAVATMP